MAIGVATVIQGDPEGEYTLVGGQKLVRVHSILKCARQWCCIHKPSNHHMVTWDQNWRPDAAFMERLCPHGIGHPDPDEINGPLVHSCDGCCTP